MIALTVRPPWSFAIAALGKDIENRSWKTEHRGLLAIHAGARFDWRGQRRIAELTGALVVKTDSSAVVAVVSLSGIHHSSACARKGRLAHLHPDGPYTCSRWALGGEGGMWHWELEQVHRLAVPVACKGRLGLWPLPDVAEAAVLEQIGDALCASVGVSPDVSTPGHQDSGERTPTAATAPHTRHPRPTDRSEDR